MPLPLIVYAGITFATRAAMLAYKARKLKKGVDILRAANKANKAKKALNANRLKQNAKKAAKLKDKTDKQIKAEKASSATKDAKRMTRQQKDAIDRKIDKHFGTGPKPLRLSKEGKAKLSKEMKGKAHKKRNLEDPKMRLRKKVRAENRTQAARKAKGLTSY